MRKTTLATALAVALLATGCGGGGGQQTPDETGYRGIVLVFSSTCESHLSTEVFALPGDRQYDGVIPIQPDYDLEWSLLVPEDAVALRLVFYPIGLGTTGTLEVELPPFVRIKSEPDRVDVVVSDEFCGPDTEPQFDSGRPPSGD